MKGVSCLLDAKMSCYESMMQMLQRRFSLKTKAVIYRKSNEFLKTQIVSCSQIRAKPAVIRGGVKMIEVLQTEVIGEGALSHRLKADRKESRWEFQGWLYLESAKPSPFQFKMWQTIVWRELNPRDPDSLWYDWLPLVAVGSFTHPGDTALHSESIWFWFELINSLTKQPY